LYKTITQVIFQCFDTVGWATRILKHAALTIPQNFTFEDRV